MIDFSLSNKLTDGIIINNDLLLVLQQIDLLFSTNINDVLGDTDFGSNYEKRSDGYDAITQGTAEHDI